VIRKTVSTTNPHGDDVIGAPKHPDWLYIVWPMVGGDTPCVMAYVHNRLACLRPALRRDIINHCNMLILSLHLVGDMVNLMNIYSDNHNYTICRLYKEVACQPFIIWEATLIVTWRCVTVMSHTTDRQPNICSL
jgi:hypothetical protein